MVSKQNRLSGRHIAILFKTAKPTGTPFFVARHASAEDGVPRFAFIAPKTIAKTATLRNSIRRKWYGSLRDALKKNQAVSGIHAFVLKKEAIEATSHERIGALEVYFKRHSHA